MSAHANPNIVEDHLVFMYDTINRKSYAGEPVVNIWSVSQGGSSVNNRTGWDKPNAYNGDITDSVYTGGTWSGNRIWEVLHTAGTTGYGGYESWRLCVSQPTAGSYSSTRRVAIKICILEGSISDLAIHSGGGNSSHNSSYFTAIPESQVPRDCPIKSGWYQFLAPANWTSTTVTHCVGLGFISYNRVKILTAEPMYYPSDHLMPFSGTERTATQGLLDRTGTSTIDISNASFDSNAQMTFDGTDDQLIVNNIGIDNYSEAFSYECVFKAEGTWANDRISNIVGILGSYGGHYGLGKSGTNTISFVVRDDNYNAVSSTVSDTSTYHHLVGVWDQSNSQIRLYIDGELKSSATVTKTGTPDSNDLRIGGRAAFGGSNGSYYHGDIPIVKYYKTALTSAEVLQNFNATKSRFGL